MNHCIGAERNPEMVLGAQLINTGYFPQFGSCCHYCIQYSICSVLRWHLRDRSAHLLLPQPHSRTMVSVPMGGARKGSLAAVPI